VRPPAADVSAHLMSSEKCARCGLVNFAADMTCRRCGDALPARAAIDGEAPSAEGGRRGFGRKLLWIVGATFTLMMVCFTSLIFSSKGLDYDQRQVVAAATAILERTGFTKEAYVLSRLVNYRSTDNWWNDYIGHQSAYAATNFPFEVVTLYPPFFEVAVDDMERAAILLHESYHLFGSGEEDALRGVWLEKQRLGWTADQYSGTRLWKNTREWTAGSVPDLFQCGEDMLSDCLE
jgi:hypothetical protein